MKVANLEQGFGSMVKPRQSGNSGYIQRKFCLKACPGESLH